MKKAKTIASERTRMGLSQTELATKLGKDRGTIVRWESDPSCISGRWLVELAKLFNCSIDYLLGLTDERMPSAVA